MGAGRDVGAGWAKKKCSAIIHMHMRVGGMGMRMGSMGGVGGKDDLLPFVCDVTGAQAAVLLMAAI